MISSLYRPQHKQSLSVIIGYVFEVFKAGTLDMTRLGVFNHSHETSHWHCRAFYSLITSCKPYIATQEAQLISTLLQTVNVESKAAHQCFTHQFENNQTGYAKAMHWFSRLQPPAIDEEIWTACITALGEAFENAVYHGQTTLETTTPTSVVVSITDEMIQIRVWDNGPGFDLEQYIKELPESVPLLAEKGRGLWIIKQIADHLSYSKTANQLNCLTIQKFLKSSNKTEASL